MKRAFPSARTKPGVLALLLTLALVLVGGGPRAVAQSGGAESAPAPAATASTLAAGTLRVGGDVPTPLDLSSEDLLKLPRTEVRAKDHDGKEAVYAGTPLVEILRAAGMKFDPGAMPGREAIASYVLVEAADGYKAVYALAEIDPTVGDRVVVLVDRKDGQPLAANEGPLRLVAPGDKRAARWVRRVTAISVRKS